MFCCSGFVISTAHLHLRKLELRLGAESNPAHGVSKICDDKNFWKWSQIQITLNAIRSRTCSLVVSDLCSETKGSQFGSGCLLFAEFSFRLQAPALPHLEESNSRHKTNTNIWQPTAILKIVICPKYFHVKIAESFQRNYPIEQGAGTEQLEKRQTQGF